jgi:hypothetical protein
MAIINKTGITNGGTIQAEHITRVIDALSGVSTDTLILSGSMTGSLIGTLTGTASFATSASRAISSSIATSASFATTASFAANASSFPFVGTARITGSLIVSGSSNNATLNTNTTTITATNEISISGSSTIVQGTASTTNWVADKNSIFNWMSAGGNGFNGQLVLPQAPPDNPIIGTIYFTAGDPSFINIWDGSMWRQFQSIV